MKSSASWSLALYYSMNNNKDREICPCNHDAHFTKYVLPGGLIKRAK